MTSKYYFFIVSFGLLFISGCISNSKSQQEKVELTEMTEKYKSTAIEKFSNPIQYIFNVSKTNVVCIKQNKKLVEDPIQALHFIIYDITKDSLIFEDSVLGGSIRWLSDDLIEIGNTPGIVSGREGEEQSSNTYYYDIKLQKKVKTPLIEIKD